MTEQKDRFEGLDAMSLDREMQDLVGQVILACGTRPLKEKVDLLYMTIDYINHAWDDVEIVGLTHEAEDIVCHIIMACGEVSYKEKISLLILAIEFIFAHNKEIVKVFTDEVTIH